MTTPLAPASTAPSIGENHPAALAFSHLNNAAQILRGGYLNQQDFDRARELISEGTAQVKALYTLFEHQERTIEEQRVECLTWKLTAESEKTYSTRVETTNSELVQSVIDLTRQLEELGVDTSKMPRSAAAAGGA